MTHVIPHDVPHFPLYGYLVIKIYYVSISALQFSFLDSRMFILAGEHERESNKIMESAVGLKHLVDKGINIRGKEFKNKWFQRYGLCCPMLISDPPLYT
jgi:hypothetical protein